MFELENIQIRSLAWSSFTPCTVASSLLEAVAEAAKNATSGDVVLRALACSSRDQFQNHQHRGEIFCQAVKSIGRGVRGGTPNIHGKTATAQQRSEARNMKNLLRVFLRGNPGEANKFNQFLNRQAQ